MVHINGYMTIALLGNYLFVEDYLEEGADIEFAVFFLLIKLTLYLYIVNCTTIEPYYALILNLIIGIMVGQYISIIEEENQKNNKKEVLS